MTKDTDSPEQLITVFYSGRDDTLRDGFQLGERWATWGRQGEPALGLVGPQTLSSPSSAVPAAAGTVALKVNAIDVTDGVSSHNPHFFLRHEAVWRAVGEAVGVQRFPETELLLPAAAREYSGDENDSNGDDDEDEEC